MVTTASGLPADALIYAVDHLEAPEGYRAEVIEGRIHVSPPPVGRHILDTTRLQYGTHDAAPDGLLPVQNVTLALSDTGQQYVPDFAVLPVELLEQDEWKFPARAAELVAEVTSPDTAEIDRVKKLRGYAREGVRVYVMVDREERVTSMSTEPQSGIYRRTRRVPFGGRLRLPEPFSGEIDTSEFV